MLIGPRTKWGRTIGCSSLLLLAILLLPHLSTAKCRNAAEGTHPQDGGGDTSQLWSCLSDELEEKERDASRFFVAVIDAGSTGTRLHLFEFSHDIQREHSPFQLEKESFKELKPGLSSYARTPHIAAASVAELLSFAKRVVPRERWRHTPITVKATAGLRLLPAGEADAILQLVEKEVLSSGLLVAGEKESVGILSGTDEGVFAWFTLNLLLERLSGGGGRETAAALDLGGGSTQITFSLTNFGSLTVPEEGFSHTLSLFGKDIELYTHSYLGNGLVAARLGIANQTRSTNLTPNTTLLTHCLPPGFHLSDWSYGGERWKVNPTPVTSFHQCLSSARHYVEEVTGVRKVPQLEEKDVYAFSYFYDRGVQAKLVVESKAHEHKGGYTTVGTYKEAAKRACTQTATELKKAKEHWRPWQCLDLSYIYALLHHGYGLPDSKALFLTKKLKGMETSWALGAGFHLLNTYHSSSTRREKREEATPFSKRQSFFYAISTPNGANASSASSQNEGGMDGLVSQLMAYVNGKVTHMLSLLRILS